MSKRSHLTLYKKKVPLVSRFTKPRHDFQKIYKGTGTSSKNSRLISPALTPSGCTQRSKRARIASPLLYAKKITASPLRTRTPPSIQHEHADHEEWVDLGSTEITVNCDDHCNLFKMFKNELVAAELWDVFRIFMNQVASTSYPLTNIALLLFLDTVKFYNCRTTTQMTYSSTSKRFWKTGYRLFHAKFLYFMSGPRNIVDNTGNTTRCIDPQTSRINFAVPNTKTLEAFTLTEVDLPKIISPGIIEPIMKSITETVSDKRFMLCADAKKVTSGVDKKGGDVDMFGLEDGDSLQQRRKRLSNEIEVLQQVVTSVNETPSDKPPQSTGFLNFCFTREALSEPLNLNSSGLPTRLAI